MRITPLPFFIAAVAFCGALPVFAQKKPFEAIATTTDGSNITVSATSSELSGFIDQILNSNGSFAVLRTHPFSASSTFLGVNNAITFVTNSNGTSATLALPVIGFTRTFTGASSDAVSDQVDDFFKKEGADTVARFLAAIADRSPVAVTDGNPTAATATTANEIFIAQGFTPTEEIAAAAGTGFGSAAGAAAKPRFSGFGIGFNAGKFEAAGFTGNNYDFSITGLSFALGERARLITPISLSYLKLEDAQVAGLSIGLALPIRLRVMDAANNLNWRLIPTGGVGLRGSADLASGALLWQAGLTNTFDYKVNSKLVLCLVNQVTLHQSISVTYENYNFDPQIDQQVLKNGIRAVTPLTARVIAEIFVIETNFLQDAAVKNFTTVGGAVSLRASQSFNLGLGGNYDTGTNFKAWSLGLSSAWRW